MNRPSAKVIKVILENQSSADIEERLFAAFEMVFARCEQEDSEQAIVVDNLV